MDLLQFIPTGRANARSTEELMRLWGCQDARAVRQMIHDLRVSGNVVCSTTEGGGGYYLPDSKIELLRFCRSMRSRINEIQKALASAERIISNFQGE